MEIDYERQFQKIAAEISSDPEFAEAIKYPHLIDSEEVVRRAVSLPSRIIEDLKYGNEA